MVESQLSKVVAGVGITDAQSTGFIPQRFNLTFEMLLIIRKELYYIQMEINHLNAQCEGCVT